jgi:hypothetical protein
MLLGLALAGDATGTLIEPRRPRLAAGLRFAGFVAAVGVIGVSLVDVLGDG